MLDPALTYDLLRHLTSPIVAVSARSGDLVNAQIANSAIRASLVPGIPRVIVQLSREHLTHDLVLESRAFALHLLGTDQMELVYRLGFTSGRSGQKLGSEEWVSISGGSPVLRHCHAYFDCRLTRTLAMGPSTLMVGLVLAAGRGDAKGEVMTSTYWREQMPEEWRDQYEAQLRESQRFAEEYLRDHPDSV